MFRFQRNPYLCISRVIILYKSIFRAAQESHVIDTNPTIYLNAKGGGIPQEDKQALTDEQAERLLDAIQGLPPYVFVMIGLYAGLRREEIPCAAMGFGIFRHRGSLFDGSESVAYRA